MAVKYKDYYETLGIARDADAEAIRKAYRELARRYHPDLNPAPDAAARFKEVGEAYEVLKDPDKRARYDSLGPGWRDGQEFDAPPGFGNVRFEFHGGEGMPSEFSDFFASLFGAGFGAHEFDQRRATGRHATGNRGGGRRGSDAEAELVLSIAEIVGGGARDVSIVDPSTGTQKTYTVRIPAGVVDGTRIRLAGQGGPGLGGGPRGDLLLRVRIAPDGATRADGHDLRTRVDITPWEAALGATVEVATADGRASLRVPPGSQSGQVLRLRGTGLADGEGGRGDVLVELRIVVPARLDAAERELFERLASESKFRPRGEQ